MCRSSTGCFWLRCSTRAQRSFTSFLTRARSPYTSASFGWPTAISNVSVVPPTTSVGPELAPRRTFERNGVRDGAEVVEHGGFPPLLGAHGNQKRIGG